MQSHGDTFLYKIDITNFEEDIICDVSEEFNISIVKTSNLPLNISIYKDEGLSEKIKANENGYYEDESFRFDAGVRETITIYILIEWNVSDNSYQYSEELDNIVLYTNVIQID